MKPIEFKEQNTIFTSDYCRDLPAFKNDEQIISCWELSFRERLKILLTGKLWFSVLDKQQPPIHLSVNTLFEEAK